ncbi:MAG: hypothetical protein K2L22_02630 [Muribaculaceae bacterium]|nr:hypothetical protein [Muribaculaceae bacterium]
MKEDDEPTISIQEAARWLARMAAKDGVVSSNERKLLKEFANKYELDPKSLYRMAHAAAKDVEIPEVELISSSKWKGRRFEEFIVSLCSDRSCFTLLSWRSDKAAGELYPIDNLMPDLCLRHRSKDGNVEFYIECKYRSSLHDDMLDINSQLDRYRQMISENANHKLFIALGLGGHPSNPETFYLIPDESISDDGIIYIDKCEKFRCANSPEAFHLQISKYLKQ